ncbi:MAG TPA: S9 family peptidase [Pseudomonadales bacterium]
MWRILAATTLWLVVTATSADDEPPAIEYFTRADEFGSLEISPDGRFVAVTAGRNGRSALAFINLEDRSIVSGVRMGENREIYDFDWISPTRVIYRIAERQPGDAFFSITGEISAINRDGRAPRLLYGYRAAKSTTGTHIAKREASYAHAELLSTLEDDEKHILIAEYPWKLQGFLYIVDFDAPPRITRLNVYNGLKRSLGVAPLASADLLVDRDDHVRFALGHDPEGRLTVSWKPRPKSDWEAFELPGFRDESVEPLYFASDNSSLYFIGVRRGQSLRALYRLELTSREVELVYAHESVDVTGLVTDFAGERVIGARFYTSRPEYHWLNEDDPAVRLYRALERAFPGQAIEVTSTTADGRLATVFVHSDVNPGDYYLFDTETRAADYLQAARAWIDPGRMQPKEPIRVEARDGLVLHGYLTRPRGGDAPYPLIVLPHGGPFGFRDRWDFDWEVQLLASRGYAVLQVNFRGSGGYGMDFEEAGYRQWGAAMQDDLTDATRWAIDQRLADPRRICIVGASYGGYAALMGVAREPGLYRCAIGHAGVYDLELLRSTGDVRFSYLGRTILASQVGDDVQELRRHSPVHLAERIEAPVMLVHGREDWRADYIHGRRMKAALERHGKAMEWLPLRGEGHGIFDESTRAEVYEQMLRFLERHLAPSAATPRGDPGQ